MDAVSMFGLLTPIVLVTATISGALGMGGGILLMGALGSLMAAPAAILLQGVIQLCTNGFRALLLRRSIEYRFVALYALGTLLSAATFASFSVVVDRKTLFITLGAVAILASLSSRRAQQGTPTWLSKRVAVWANARWFPLCSGLLVTAGHLTAGAAGPLLDVFFLDTSLDRHGVVATKAITQTIGHATKIVYMLALTPATIVGSALSVWGYAGLLVCGLVGTHAGTLLLKRMNEQRFREISRNIVLLLGTVYLARGLMA